MAPFQQPRFYRVHVEFTSFFTPRQAGRRNERAKPKEGRFVESMMRRPLKRLLGYFLLFVGGVVLVVLISHRSATRDDPVFGGRRLSSWLVDIISPDPEAAAASSNAIVQLGTKSHPFLIQELSAEDGKMRKWIGLRGGYGGWFWPAPLRKLRACKAAQVLGPEAQGIAPYVTNLLSSPIASLRLSAFNAAAAMDLRNVESALTNSVVSDASISVRVQAARNLLSLGYDPAQVLDLLVTNSWSRGQRVPALRGFASAIKSMPFPPELLEAKIMEYAKNEHPQVRTLVAVGLPVWLPDSETMILTELAKDTNATVSKAASNSLSLK